MIDRGEEPSNFQPGAFLTTQDSSKQSVCHVKDTENSALKILHWEVCICMSSRFWIRRERDFDIPLSKTKISF